MEINNSSYVANTPATDKTAATRAAPADTTVPPAPPVTGAAASSVVSLSDAGKQAAGSDKPDDTSKVDDADQPSGAKAFAYGTLGLGVPKAAKEETKSESKTDSYYTAGRMLAAAATVGTIISLVA